ncbi:MAG TPA: hypothetical protein VN641_12905 [Urbifossiella sp.]|nr:hypothetical protein [Urbifossiella sp.]
MRNWLVAPLLFTAALLASFADNSPAFAQKADGAKPEEETFTTADGVRLKGLFHRAETKIAGNPVVILLYQPGAGNTMDKPGDWAGLTKTLTKKGFNVFRFDWRGHGKSKDIVDGDLFWNNSITGPWNRRFVKGFNKKPPKGELDVKNDLLYGNKYYPMFVQDLAAVRNQLDGKNDQGDLSTSSIYLIGAGDAATIGMLWMSEEWMRPEIHPQFLGTDYYQVSPLPMFPPNPGAEAGNDIAGAVWLSASRLTSIPERLVTDWSKANLKLRDNNHMLFLYGDKDKKGHLDAKFFYDQVLVAKGNKNLGVKQLEQTFLREVQGTALKGVSLLGNDGALHTETDIMKFLEARQKDRASKVRRQRKYAHPYFINLQAFGINPR